MIEEFIMTFIFFAIVMFLLFILIYLIYKEVNLLFDKFRRLDTILRLQRTTQQDVHIVFAKALDDLGNRLNKLEKYSKYWMKKNE